MKNFFSFLALLLVTLAAAARDDKVSFPDIKGWDLEEYVDVYTPANLWDLINGAAESYLAYDFIDLHLADYLNENGDIIHAEVYRHSSPENTFGIYSSERSPDYGFVDIGGQAYLDQGVLNAYSGKYYIKLYSTDVGPSLQVDLQVIAKAIVKGLGEGDTVPQLLEIFPEKEKIPNSEHYIAKNFLGFDFLHNAFTADYQDGYRLFIIEGKDAGEIIKMVSSYLEFTKQDIDPDMETSFIIRDKYNGDIPVYISGEYFIGIQNGEDTARMEKTLAGFVRRLGAME